MFFDFDEFYMRRALKKAEEAALADEVPVGAVIVYEHKIIGAAGNQVETLSDSTAHAEILAITQACEYLKSKYLHGCSLYVTVEPCLMCAGALVLSRLDRVVYGTPEPKTGAFISQVNLNELQLNHKFDISGGLLAEECAAILQDFFKRKRKTKKEEGDERYL